MKKMFRSLAALVFGCLAVLALAGAFGRSKATVHAAQLAVEDDTAADAADIGADEAGPEDDTPADLAE